MEAKNKTQKKKVNSNSTKEKTSTKKVVRKKKKDIKKEHFIYLVVIIILLIIMTFAAAYSYFVVTSDNSYSRVNVSTTVESVGSAFLSSGENLRIALTAPEMMKKSNDVVYYASKNGTTTDDTTEIIGTASASGNGIFNCEYDLNLTATGTDNMYDAFQAMDNKGIGQIILTINNVDYDFNTSSLFPKTIHGTFTHLVEGSDQNITAKLKIVNSKLIDQSALAGTNLILSFTVENFNCVISTD